MPTGTLLAWVTGIIVLLIISFIIWFPIIAFYYMRKIKKIKQNIPKEYLEGGEKYEQITNSQTEEESRTVGEGVGRVEGRESPGGNGGGNSGGEDLESRRDIETDNLFEGRRGISAPDIEPKDSVQQDTEREERDSEEDWPSFE